MDHLNTKVPILFSAVWHIWRFCLGCWRWLVLGISGAGLLIALSIWQWHRAEVKTQLLTRMADMSAAGSVNPQELMAESERADGVTVEFEGHWVPPAVWLVDNQIVDGRVGYDVVVPVQVSGLEHLLLVNLGWVEAPPERARLPLINIPSVLAIKGIYRGHTGGLLLGQNLEDKGVWPMRIQQLNVDVLQRFLAKPIVPGVIYQQTNNYFHAHYRPVILAPERHRAYALQWALLATAWVLVLILLYRNTTNNHEQK